MRSGSVIRSSTSARWSSSRSSTSGITLRGELADRLEELGLVGVAALEAGHEAVDQRLVRGAHAAA